jgi:hypothetical protein
MSLIPFFRAGSPFAKLNRERAMLEGDIMSFEESGIPAIDEDPVLRFLLSGAAATLDEAEECYLDASMPEILRLLESPLSDKELSNHPLMVLLRAHGSRGWEDSVL